MFNGGLRKSLSNYIRSPYTRKFNQGSCASTSKSFMSTESNNKRVKLSPDVESLRVSEVDDKPQKPILTALPDVSASEISHTTELASAVAAEPKAWKPLVWVDCEMTGLNVYEDNIIEICCLITDGNLKLIDEKGYESTIYVPKEKLDAMDEWCLDHHGSSGLIEKVLTNKDKTIEVVQEELLEYLQSHIDPKQGVLAGNTIHMDRFFMNREMPKVIDFLHYRIVDVSSVMEMGFRHNPELMKKFPKKKGAHTARSDILESLEQLRWYRDNYFVQPIPKISEEIKSNTSSTKVSESKEESDIVN